ncbi:MAG: DUF2948 family protein [Proteobacteria bacterium]|nr:DUF2948 family protein [Pseudomonadota bacterium]
MQVPSSSLKLKVQTTDDVKLLSAYLQDALVSTQAMRHDADEHGFSLFVNRFQWEVPPLEHEGGVVHGRTHTGVHFSHVSRVRHRHLPQGKEGHFLNLLTCHADAPGEIHLVFSGGCEICLHVDHILCHLMDMGEPWYTPHAPRH